MTDFTAPEPDEPTREEIEQMPGLLVVEFGASWCGHCQALRPDVDRMKAEFGQVRHVWVEDGKGHVWAGPLASSCGRHWFFYVTADWNINW